MRTRTLVVLLVLTVAGCSGIPTGGRVTQVADGQASPRSATRYEPAKPRPGASARQIVDGYIDAMLAHPVATGIVQAYLTPKAAKRWDPDAGMSVYSRVRTSVSARAAKGRATAALRIAQTMALGSDGRASLDHRVIRREIDLRQVNGEWRIDTPIDGYLVSARFASDYLRPFPLWFFDRDGARLIPELTHGIVSRQLAAELVQRLAEGPKDASLRTFIPPANQVRVEVKGRIAEVHLRGVAHDASDRLRAQVLSTLRSAPGIAGVRILHDGEPDGGVHPIDAVVGFGPRSVPEKIYGIAGGRIVDIENHRRPIAGPWSKEGRDVVALAVDSTNLAVVRAGRGAVEVGPRTGRVDHQVVTGTDFAVPFWDDEHQLWLVDQPDAPRVRIFTGNGVRAIAATFNAPVESFAVSPDGARYVACMRRGDDGEVVVGSIQRGADGEVVGLGPSYSVSAGLRDERSAAWISRTRIGFLSKTVYGPQLHAVGFDGADALTPSTRSAVPGGGIGAWAGAPVEGADLWAVDRHGRLWRQVPGGMWQAVAKGPIRALVLGR
jgi:hypothetical protein